MSSGDPFILKVVYTFFPKRYMDMIIPSSGQAPFGRQAAAIFGGCFVVGASMELFMIKTGFYDVATRKEAERRAMVQWQVEEAARMRDERRRKRAEAEDMANASKSKVELLRLLADLREKEKTEGVQLDDEKAKIKGFIKAAR